MHSLLLCHFFHLKIKTGIFYKLYHEREHFSCPTFCHSDIVQLHSAEGEKYHGCFRLPYSSVWLSVSFIMLSSQHGMSDNGQNEDKNP